MRLVFAVVKSITPAEPTQRGFTKSQMEIVNLKIFNVKLTS